jgi:chromosome segregation ATPase
MSTPPEMAYAAPQVEQQAVTPTVTPTGFPTRSSSRKYRPPTNNYFPPMPHSAREPTTDDYYYETSGVGSQSLPPTPLNNASFQTDLSSLDPRLQSIEKLYEEQKRQMHALSHEKDHVQRQLAFFRTKLSEFDAEKASHLRATKDTEESLQITLMKLREAKVSESAAQNEFQSARNEISILEARCEEEKRLKTALAAELVEERTRSKGLEAKLEEVNVQKIDLLERELEMRMEIVVTKKKYKKSAGELIDLKRKQSKAQLAEEDAETKLKEALSRNQVLEEHLKQLSPESDLPSVVAQMAFKLEDLQRQLKDKDELVGNLKTQNTEATQAAAQSVSTLKAENDQLTANVQTLQAGVVNVARSSPSPTSELKVLQQKAANLEASLNTARNEREQYANLLHAEVRRTAVEQHERTHPALPLLKKKLDLEEAVELVRSRAAAFLKPSQQAESEERHDTPINAEQDRSFDTDADATEKIQTLQKEIDYYLNDIVLYKLDVKGYKKDLRKARERIRELSDGAGLSGKGSVGSGSSSGARTERLSGGGTEDVLSDGGNRV